MIRSKSVGQGQPPCSGALSPIGPGKHHRRPRNPSARGCSAPRYKARPEPVDSAVNSKPNNEVTVPGRLLRRLLELPLPVTRRCGPRSLQSGFTNSRPSKTPNEVTVPGIPVPEYHCHRNTNTPNNEGTVTGIRNTEETARQAGLSQLWTVGGTGLWEKRRPGPTLNAVLRAGKETGSVKRGKRPNGRPLSQMHHSVGLARAKATNDEKGPPRLLLLGRQPDFGRITENIAAGGKDDYINETHCFFGQNNVEEPFL
jgi:hypothetical protein